MEPFTYASRTIVDSKFAEYSRWRLNVRLPDPNLIEVRQSGGRGASVDQAREARVRQRLGTLDRPHGSLLANPNETTTFTTPIAIAGHV